MSFNKLSQALRLRCSELPPTWEVRLIERRTEGFVNVSGALAYLNKSGLKQWKRPLLNEKTFILSDEELNKFMGKNYD